MINNSSTAPPPSGLGNDGEQAENLDNAEKDENCDSVVTVLFVGGIFSAPQVIESIRAAAQANPLGPKVQIVVSHRANERRGIDEADAFVLEPDETSRDPVAFMDWCLEVAAGLGVDVIVPRRNVAWFADARQRFQELGIQVIVPGDACLLASIENKAALYLALPSHLVAIPQFRTARTMTDFEDAYAELSSLGTVCIKPTVGIAARGFRVLDPALGVGRADADVYVSLEEARQELSALNRFPELMVMPYLPGPERSVDCLAHHGRLVVGIVRRKLDVGEQLLEDHPELLALAAKLTEYLKLHGLFNIQFMQGSGGQQFLLEINTRMSGGIYLSARSGVCLPYWAVLLALGLSTPGDVPAPVLGVRASKR